MMGNLPVVWRASLALRLLDVSQTMQDDSPFVKYQFALYYFL
jgi:hypothetical protein